MSTLKERLRQKPRKLIKEVEVDGEKLELRRPTHKERVAVVQAARTAGELNEQNEPKDEESGLRMVARITACVLFDPATKERVFDPMRPADVAELADMPWLEDLQKDAAMAFKPSLEEARGKSEATPS